ncbi:hypothetical protein NBO_389g0002, partial [Nosema bombycis CQ1]
MKGISIHGIIKILSNFNLSENNIEDIRKAFGYNVIYKTYKNIIENIYLKHYTREELGLVMKLLDNEKLSFSRSLDTFNRLNEYISNNIIDKNLTSCCIVLMSIIEHSPSMINDKKIFLNSMLTYLINILFERSNFVFYDQHDTDIIIKTIETLCEVDSVKLSSYDFKVGLIRRCLFNLDLFFESNSSIYEEVMSFIAILRSLGIFLDLCYNTKSLENQDKNRFKIYVLKKKNSKGADSSDTIEFETTGFINKISDLITSKFINDLEKYKLPDNLCLGYKDDELAKIRFISAKFYVLNTVAKITDILINRVHFYNDVYAQTKPKFIFDNISNLKSQISWSDLIILATNSPSKFDFILILLDPFYIQNLEHFSYIFLFVFSLKEDYTSILFLTKKLVKLNEFLDVEKYWEILIYIFIHYLEINDERMSKTRFYIIKKCIDHKERLQNILKILVRDCNKDNILINDNLYPLLFFIIFNLDNIDTEIFFDCYNFIVTQLNDDNKTLETSECDIINDKIEEMCIHDRTYIILKTQNYKRDDNLFNKLNRKTLNVSLLIQLMSIYKPPIRILFTKYKKSKYYKSFNFLQKLSKKANEQKDELQDTEKLDGEQPHEQKETLQN